MSHKQSGRTPKYILRDMQDCLGYMHCAALEKSIYYEKYKNSIFSGKKWLTVGEKEMMRNTVKWCNRMLVRHKKCGECKTFTERLIGENQSVYERECRVCGCKQIYVTPTHEDGEVETAVVECCDCRYRNPHTSVCSLWEKAVDADGFCYKGEEVERDTVADEGEYFDYPLSYEDFAEDEYMECEDE